MAGNSTEEYEKREHQTQVNMARGIVAHSTGLKEDAILEIEDKLAREGLEPSQIEKSLIEKAKETELPKPKS